MYIAITKWRERDGTTTHLLRVACVAPGHRAQAYSAGLFIPGVYHLVVDRELHLPRWLHARETIHHDFVLREVVDHLAKVLAEEGRPTSKLEDIGIGFAIDGRIYASGLDRSSRKRLKAWLAEWPARGAPRRSGS